jgi:hypothetical protein
MVNQIRSGAKGSFTLGVVIALVLSAGACRDLPGGRTAGANPGGESNELLIFAFDRSNSILDHELEHAVALTQERLKHLDHGDRFAAMDLLQLSLGEPPRRWAQQIPDRQFPDQEMPRDSVALSRFVRDASEYIENFANAEGRDGIHGTDILSTLHLVAAEMAGFPDSRPTLILFSDMLQANAVMNMEGLLRMPPANWVESEAKLGTLPDLTGLCVVAVGVLTDDRGTQVVRQFWEEYFRTTGATLLPQNYSYRPVQIPHRPCPGL